MDENTRFIIKRIDNVEKSLLREIKELQAFRNRVLGLSIGISFIVSSVVEVLIRKLGG